jgi:hypothetical protein
MPRAPPARGLKAIIAGAGGAAHLPGMIAAKTRGAGAGRAGGQRKHLSGVDSLHSIVQMPKGVPVATFAIGAAAPPMPRCLPWRCWPTGMRAAGQARPVPRRADRSRTRHDATGGAGMSIQGKTGHAPRHHGHRPSDHAGRDGRRAARAHVRAGGPGHGLFHGRARSGSGQPGRAGEPLSHPDRLPGRAGPGPTDAALRRHHHRVRERSGAGAVHAGRTPPGGSGRRCRADCPEPHQGKSPFRALRRARGARTP